MFRAFGVSLLRVQSKNAFAVRQLSFSEVFSRALTRFSRPEFSAPSSNGMSKRFASFESKASELKANQFIEHEGKVWQVHSVTRSAQGAQRSVLIMVEMKEYKTGRKSNFRFDQDDPISVVRFESAVADVLYREGDTFFVMNPDSFEQSELQSSDIGDGVDYVTEGMRLTLNLYNGAIMRVELPGQVLVEIVETESRMKNATGTQTKRAVLSNGRTIQVPPHVLAGQKVWIRPTTDEFVKREN